MILRCFQKYKLMLETVKGHMQNKAWKERHQRQGRCWPQKDWARCRLCIPDRAGLNGVSSLGQSSRKSYQKIGLGLWVECPLP